MRIFIAGATGVLGRNLIPKLLKRGHSVVGTSSTKERLQELEHMGSEAILMNGLDRDSVLRAVTAAKADVVVNQMTSLASVQNYRNFDKEFELTNRLRREGTAYLLEAARQNEVRKIVVQSFAGWPLQAGSVIANPEETPYAMDLPARMKNSLRAIQQMEEMVVSSQSPVGVVLRYGFFYGPGTSFDSTASTIEVVRKGNFPVIGKGTGVWSFIHVEDAAEATRIAIEDAPAGTYHVTDDHPAAVAEWLPELARLLEAKPPKRVPVWLGRLFAGASTAFMMTKMRGAANGKAKRVLEWRPSYADWRHGFAAMLRRPS